MTNYSEKTTLSPEILVDKIKGVIYGNAIGDAIGLATEFMSKPEAAKHYGNGPLTYSKIIKDHHRSRWRKGDWTDDTDQMILILDGFLSTGTIDYLDFAKRLKYWVHHGFPELGDQGGLGIGQTVYSVVSNPSFEYTPHEAAQSSWEKTQRSAAANGAVMRTSFLGIPNFDDPTQVVKQTLAIAKTTHADPRCQASSCLVTLCISAMLKGHETHSSSVIQEMINNSISILTSHIELNYDPDPIGLVGYTKMNLTNLKLDEEPKIGYTYKCLGAGIWALTKGQDFEETLTKIVLEAGDADTNGAVAGALLGCKLGYSNLPKHWLEGLVHKEWLDRKVEKLLQHLALPSSSSSSS